jgi:sec-independent protein translocase protein TatB
MFEIGFWELVVIAVIALLVLGPERLPGVARTAGHWVGKARGTLRSIKHEIDRELAAEELKRVMAEQAKSDGLHEILEDTKQIDRELREATAEPSSAQPAKPTAATPDDGKA